MLVSVAESPENRAYFGTTGTAGGTSPFAQLRIVALTARAGRAILPAAMGKASGTPERHSPRVQKARPKFGHTSATKKTVTGKHQVIVYAPGRC
jgi:hypothetical protein